MFNVPTMTSKTPLLNESLAQRLSDHIHDCAAV